MEQPQLGEVNQSRKQCWGCPEWIPYEFGFCDACWSLLSEVEQQVVTLTLGCAPTLGGQIRGAVAQHIKNLRRPPSPPYSPVFQREKKVRRELPPINLELGDLEI